MQASRQRKTVTRSHFSGRIIERHCNVITVDFGRNRDVLHPFFLMMPVMFFIFWRATWLGE